MVIVRRSRHRASARRDVAELLTDTLSIPTMHVSRASRGGTDVHMTKNATLKPGNNINRSLSGRLG